MARIPEAELEHLKAEVSVVGLAEARGVELKRRGKELVGKCPFHEDATPSLSISPAKNLWQCFGCGAGGDVLAWVMKAEGVTLPRAVEILEAGLSGTAEGSGRRPGPSQGTVPKRGAVRKLPVLATREAGDGELLARVVAHYHETLKASPQALAYLAKRGLGDPELVDRFRLGYANRSLGHRLPEGNRIEGAALRSRLTRLGVLRETGHENLAGSLVVPIFDASGNVAQLYGRKIRDDLRAGTADHLYLPGAQRGVWNREGLKGASEVILCEAVIDAMTFWVAGYRNVTTAYGVNGMTPDLWEAFREHGTRRVLIAFDQDEAGERGASQVAKHLGEQGLEAWRIPFPKGMDANEYAGKVQPAWKSLGLVVRDALWLGKGERPKRGTADRATPERENRATPVDGEAADEAERTAAEEGRETEPGAVGAESMRESETAATTKAAPMPESPARVPSAAPPLVVVPALPAPPVTGPDLLPSAAPPEAMPASSAGIPAEGPAGRAVTLPVSLLVEDGAHWLCRGDRTYRVEGLEDTLGSRSMKVVVRASRPGVGSHSDNFDFSVYRLRAAFAKQAAVELGAEEAVIQREVGLLLDALEEARKQLAKGRTEPAKQDRTLSDLEREEALALLCSPDLLDQVLRDFTRVGVVGETTNKLVGYLAAVSRKLKNPLAVVIQSSSAAGKTSLMDAVLSFLPEEERVQYSAMTGQSLFYMSETDLRWKVLAIAEEEGAERASYALKLLQSEGVLVIASTGKDPTTGRLVTHEYRVEGPVMIFLTTTAIEMDEELLNRCLVLTVDESREQTRAIHRIQRQRQTLHGVLEDEERNRLVRRHQNAQRLLRPLRVVNPYAEELIFLDHRIRARRDHPKYLAMIQAIALLHQYQREVRTARTASGAEVQYIEATREDIALADRLCREVLRRSGDELPPQTRSLLGTIRERVQQRAKEQGIERSEVRFTRREVREWTGASQTQTQVHMQRLEELEYLLAYGGGSGQRRVYELLDEGRPEGKAAEAAPDVLPASPPISEAYPSNICNYDGNLSGPVGGVSRGCRPGIGGVSAPRNPAKTSQGSGGADPEAGKRPKTHYKGNGGTHPGPTDIPVVAVAAAALAPPEAGE